MPWLSLIGMPSAAAAVFFMERSVGRSWTVTLGALTGLVLPVMTILGAMEVNQEFWGFLVINPGIGALTWILACVVAAILPWRKG